MAYIIHSDIIEALDTIDRGMHRIGLNNKMKMIYLKR